MNGRLTYITLAVADLDRAAGFYVKLFEWPTPKEVFSARLFALPAITVALIERTAAQSLCGTPFSEGTPTGTLLSWNTASREKVDELVQRGGDLGASISQPGHQLPWGGYAGVLRTEDGHFLEIVWNPDVAVD